MRAQAPASTNDFLSHMADSASYPEEAELIRSHRAALTELATPFQIAAAFRALRSSKTTLVHADARPPTADAAFLVRLVGVTLTTLTVFLVRHLRVALTGLTAFVVGCCTAHDHVVLQKHPAAIVREERAKARAITTSMEPDGTEKRFSKAASDLRVNRWLSPVFWCCRKAGGLPVLSLVFICIVTGVCASTTSTQPQETPDNSVRVSIQPRETPDPLRLFHQPIDPSGTSFVVVVVKNQTGTTGSYFVDHIASSWPELGLKLDFDDVPLYRLLDAPTTDLELVRSKLSLKYRLPIVFIKHTRLSGLLDVEVWSWNWVKATNTARRGTLLGYQQSVDFTRTAVREALSESIRPLRSGH